MKKRLWGLFFLSSFSGAEPRYQDIMKNCLEKVEKINPDYARCEIIKPATIVDEICTNPVQVKDKPATSQEISQVFEEIRELTSAFVKKHADLSKDQKEALIERLAQIPKYKTIFCKKSEIHYDSLKSKIEGCLPESISQLEVSYYFAHEFGHALGPCAYHASWSPLSFKALGRVLKYSDPMNYEKSLSEYPLNKLIKCLPVDKVSVTTMNQVNSGRWNIMCARNRLDEAIADLIGNATTVEYLKKKGLPLANSGFELARLYCPQKGLVRKGKIVNGKAEFKDEIHWIESPEYPSFELRYAIFHQTFLAAGVNMKNLRTPSIQLQSCHSF